MGSRTPDLLIANETLYQLSYDPIHFLPVEFTQEDAGCKLCSLPKGRLYQLQIERRRLCSL